MKQLIVVGWRCIWQSFVYETVTISPRLPHDLEILIQKTNSSKTETFNTIIHNFYRPKTKFARVCFHGCLSVHRGVLVFVGGVSVHGVSVQGVSVQGVSVWGVSLHEVSVLGALSRGSLSRGSLSEESLSRSIHCTVPPGVSVQRVSVQRGLCQGGEGHCPGRSLSRGSLSWGSLSGGGLCQEDSPVQ